MPQTVSLIVRCFNEEAHIGRLLTGVMRQTQRPDEIIVVDSGSTDATLAIASAFDVKVVHIAPGTFSFGGSLNKGLEAAEGDIAVFASAHVYPVYDTWIERLIEPFEDDAIALSYGRQVVPPDGAYAEGRLLAQWFPSQSTAHQNHPFCNNANAAIRRDVWRDVPYDDQLTGLEDLDWAKKVLARGHLLSYRADAPIVHVHDESFSQIVNRYRREAIAHKQIYDEQELTLAHAIQLGIVNVAGDLNQARREGVLVREARGVVRFRLAQFLGAYRGFRQNGPVSELLRWRFYYPPQAGAQPPADHATPPGTPINYDEPLDRHSA
jgi:glycosyltransferase involved in cell wall biosynthesis